MAKVTSKNEKTPRKRRTTKRKAAEQAALDASEQQGANSTSTITESAPAAETKEQIQKSKKAEDESTHAKYERIEKGS